MAFLSFWGDLETFIFHYYLQFRTHAVLNQYAFYAYAWTFLKGQIIQISLFIHELGQKFVPIYGLLNLDTRTSNIYSDFWKLKNVVSGKRENLSIKFDEL